MLGMTYGTASVRNGCVWEEDRVEGFHSFARDAQYQQIRNDNNTVTQAQYFFPEVVLSRPRHRCNEPKLSLQN